MTHIRVLLVEDNAVYRSTLELLLEGRAGIEIVGSVADGAAAAAVAESLDPDVVLMDFRLPHLDGAQATAAVRKQLAASHVEVETTFAPRTPKLARHSTGNEIPYFVPAWALRIIGTSTTLLPARMVMSACHHVMPCCIRPDASV